MARNLADALVEALASNWASANPPLALPSKGGGAIGAREKSIVLEIESLRNGKDASLPYFFKDTVHWITLSENEDDLRAAIEDLRAWVLPSYGWESGWVHRAKGKSPITEAALKIAAGYFKWKCRAQDFDEVVKKLAARRNLEARRPARSRRARPSRYELRSRFSEALLVGDRAGAEDAVRTLDQLHLETSVNTDCMRIRMWRHFREFEKIASFERLPLLLSQRLPPIVAGWIGEAQQAMVPVIPEEAAPPVTPAPEPAPKVATWAEWFKLVAEEDRNGAERLLERIPQQNPEATSLDQARSFEACLEDLFLRHDEAPLNARRELLCQGLSDFMQGFVREPQFPRAAFGKVYLALLRLWGALRAGDGTGEAGHVLLELADAALRLNIEPAEVKEIIRRWWEARKVSAQLPFLLDAIELLDREQSDKEAVAGLWFESAEFLRRDPDCLTPSEKSLWRSVGLRIGMPKSDLKSYVPVPTKSPEKDAVALVGLKKVAIVCGREQQARDASKAIQERTGATVVVVKSGVAGAETDGAVKADVVLFVWMATTHAVFRAFDGFDREKFVYVQGTGAASIMRALERWVVRRS